MAEAELVDARVAFAVRGRDAGCGGADVVGIGQMNETQRVVGTEQRDLVVEAAIGAVENRRRMSCGRTGPSAFRRSA